MNDFVKTDIEYLCSIWNDSIESVNMFGSYPNKLTNAEDIDVAIHLKKALSAEEFKSSVQNSLNIPIAQIDIECYRNIQTDCDFGYHFLLLLSEKAKKEFECYYNQC